MKFFQTVLGKVVAVLLAVFLVVLSVKTGTEAWAIKQQSHQFRNTITVSADGEVDVVPDVADINFSVVSKAETRDEVELDNTERMNAIIEALASLDIEEKDIKTSQYNLQPEYSRVVFDEPRDELEELIGYTLRQSLRVTIRDTEQAGELIQMATRLGADQIGGLIFMIDDPEEFREEARAEAFAKAHEKAEVLAKQAGVRLGKVVSFSDEGQLTPQFGMAMESRAMNLDASMDEISSPPLDINGGKQTVSARVSMTFEIY